MLRHMGVMLSCAVMVFAGLEEHKLDHPPSWKDTDVITVYYGDFKLAAWAFHWHTYHSGVAFHNNNTGEKCLYDFVPDDTSDSTTKLVFPNITAKTSGPWALVRMLLLGEAEVQWNNGAHINLYVGDTWPENYKNFVELGMLSGMQFQRYAEWIATEFRYEAFTFDPYELLAIDDSNGSVVVKDHLPSQMCHDFVTTSLWVLYHNGVRFKPKSPIYRDHLIVYASEFTPRPGMIGSKWHMRSMFRFYRTCFLFLEKIKQSLVYGRETLSVVWRLGIPAIITNKQMYYQIKLAPPFGNYCYLSLAIPPEVHDPLAPNKMCFLDIEANFSKASMPAPYGLELGVEEQLDQPTVVLSFFMVMAASVLPATFMRSKSQ